MKKSTENHPDFDYDGKHFPTEVYWGPSAYQKGWYDYTSKKVSLYWVMWALMEEPYILEDALKTMIGVKDVHPCL